MSQFENLVFEGGGVKGIAYAGAIAVLEKRGMLADIRRVAGTSAGAITACLVALGADAQETTKIATATPFPSFEDSDFGYLRDALRLVQHYGWYKGDAFAQWMRQQIAALSGNPQLDFATLADWAVKAPAKYRQLFVVGTDLSGQCAKVFSAATTPDVPIWLAARISMSLPLVFTAVKRKQNVWVDGGLTWNYPLDLFDRARFVQGLEGAPEDRPEDKHDDKVYNKATLGFRVDTRAEITAERTHFGLPSMKVDNFISYAKALIGFMIDTANHAHLQAHDWQRTVFIDSHGISTTDFDLSEQQIASLVESGRLGTQAYFEWFDDRGQQPLNRMG